MTKTNKKIISISASVIVAVLIIVTVLNHFCTQKMNKADALVTSGKYNDALKVYEEVQKLTAGSKLLQAKIDETLILKKSVDAFNTGIKGINTKDYLVAFSNFKSVVKKDSKHYTIALEKMKQCVKLSDACAIKQAQDSASKGNYDTAIGIIENASTIDAFNPKMNSLDNEYKDDKVIADAKAQVIANAKVKADEDAKADAELQARTQKPTIGMTKAEVRKGAWGDPQKINRTTNAYGTTEQWVYDFKYLYFDVNGLLTDIQD